MLDLQAIQGGKEVPDHLTEEMKVYASKQSLRYDQVQLKQFSEKVALPMLGVDLAAVTLDAVKRAEIDDRLSINDSRLPGEVVRRQPLCLSFRTAVCRQGLSA